MEKKARKILSNNNFMTLATASSDGQPWSTPLFYAWDNERNFYWYSRKDTRHSTNINENPRVSASIFSMGGDEDGIGIYIEGSACELSESEVEVAVNIYASKGATNDEEKRQLLEVQDFLDDSPLRMYKLEAVSVYISNEASKWKGKWLDTRSEVTI